MPVTYTTNVAEVKQTIENNKNVLVIFYSPECAKCKASAPMMDKLADEHTNLKFFKVDATTATDYAAEYSIASLPTFVFFQNQNVMKKAPGSSEVLEEILKMVQ
ncbi:thioredoxin, putative [Entamoeba invadens IP1]|uniref:Thioredoxin, putative n=1 Tax=Entamoeba invadens IP1 TaxID=370355 RepID=L7FMC2_ENTIV|nr:thioredoxin, putative [Entamoeba invadens IP1]ELP88639.1 thioredoxin, putative [Entamoeba invadens IP1]|eukprot:XP_004255410.1 thioredoxin, putative [Entamoeba invadens IP1]